jgi:hypothetical protein
MKKHFADQIDGIDERTDDADAPTEEISLEELAELEESVDPECDLAMEDIVDTQHWYRYTYNPHLAQDQGLVYIPPEDPPVLPAEDPEGIRVATGFAPSMEEADPDVEELPPHVDDNDLDLEEDICIALQNNSETSHLTGVHVRVRNRVAWIRGLAETEDDIGHVADVVASLKGVRDVVIDLDVPL